MRQFKKEDYQPQTKDEAHALTNRMKGLPIDDPEIKFFAAALAEQTLNKTEQHLSIQGFISLIINPDVGDGIFAPVLKAVTAGRERAQAVMDGVNAELAAETTTETATAPVNPSAN